MTGNKAGFIRCLEEKLGRPLQWVVCLLHCNELPLRQWFPTFMMHSSLCSFWNFSFLPYENFHFSLVRVRRLVLITIGTMMFIAVQSLRRASWDLAPSNKVQSLPQIELWNINRWSFYQISEYKPSFRNFVATVLLY